MANVKMGKDGEKGFATRFLEGVPLLSGLVKELSKTGTFKKRLEEADEQVEENLRRGDKKILSFETDISVRPIIEETKKEGGEVFIGNEYLTGRMGNKLLLAVKVPQEEIQMELKDKTLRLQAKKWKKVVHLPARFSKVVNIKYEKGILMVELAK